MRDDRPLMTVTLMGGDMQAQGNRAGAAQRPRSRANLQAASDMARFRHVQVPNVLTMESPLAARVGPALRAMGHVVEPVDGENMGGIRRSCSRLTRTPRPLVRPGLEIRPHERISRSAATTAPDPTTAKTARPSASDRPEVLRRER
jgi:gamma-glutamyltranspeptidase/glutathione hydrolase